jgi:hypothetical protein
MQWALLPLLVASAQAAFRQTVASDRSSVVQKQAVHISPELEPGSDKKFFSKDYPWDKRPVADKYYVFNHPYPAVQDSGDFDRDFVKDENSDGGRWKAQMEYDTLRSKIRKAKDKLADLKEKMEKEYQDWQRSKSDASKSSDQLEQAGKTASSARQAAEAAEKRVNDLEGHSSTKGTKVGGSIGDAVKKVQDEMSDLEKCKKALAEAKKRLKNLLKEKEEFEKKKAAAKKAREEWEKKKAEQEAAEEAAEKAAAEKAEKEGKKVEKKPKKPKKEAPEPEEEESTFDEAAWQKKLDREKKHQAEALNKYEDELKDVKLTEDQLARAADNLRKFRRPPYVDDNGGVYNEPGKSGAFSAGLPVAIVLAVLAAMMAA